jgi:hypothetical protein
MAFICCGRAMRQFVKKSNGKTVYSVQCDVCGRRVDGANGGEIEKKLKEGTANLPVTATQLPQYAAAHLSDLAHITVPFIARDRPALTRLVKNNVRYIINQKTDNFLDCWKSKEGQESIVHALEEALSLGAELGKMGSLVPFGGVVEFIPGVEAYEFALTNGSNPPFAWINIEMIHANDVYDIKRVNGEFACSIKESIPRGKLLAVAVYGYNNRLNHIIGEVYDTERLLGKAKQHSTSYRYYLQDLLAYEQARSEGKTKTGNGREYFEKTMFKKDGSTWTKKLFVDDIMNPYEGPDQPEMMRKLAGKSFLGKYARVRNAEAAMGEVVGGDPAGVDDIVDSTIDAAFAVYEDEQEPEAPVAPEENDAHEEPTAEELAREAESVDKLGLF